MNKLMQSLLVVGVVASVAVLGGARSQEKATKPQPATPPQAATPAQQAPPAQKVPVMMTPTDVKWVDAPPSLPAGAKMAVLQGDPAMPGLFTMRVKVPADYKVAPHYHDADEHVTVISGAMNVALGDAFDATKAKELPAGSFSLLPAKSHHYVFTKAETVIQIHGSGPWNLVYVNPADDPSAKK